MNFWIGVVLVVLAIYVIGIFISIPIMVWHERLDVFKPCLESSNLDDYVENALGWPLMLIYVAWMGFYNIVRHVLTATIIRAYDLRHKKDGEKYD